MRFPLVLLEVIVIKHLVFAKKKTFFIEEEDLPKQYKILRQLGYYLVEDDNKPVGGFCECCKKIITDGEANPTSPRGETICNPCYKNRRDRRD